MRPLTTLHALLVLLALLAAALSAHAQTTGIAARAALSPAVEAAKKWRADARLTNVSALRVSLDGTSASWDYSFYSPATGKFGLLTAKGAIPGGAFVVKEVPKGLKDAVAEDFIDSPRALAQALQHGLRGDAPVMRPAMGLTSKGWAVHGGLAPGNVSVWLDARTGAFLKNEEIPKY